MGLWGGTYVVVVVVVMVIVSGVVGRVLCSGSGGNGNCKWGYGAGLMLW